MYPKALNSVSEKAGNSLHRAESYGIILASLGKGAHARRTFRHAFRCVIVLDLRQQACVLCLAKTAPERPAGLRVFPEDKRQLARQTRQMGCRPSTRITKPDVVWSRENHVCSCQATLRIQYSRFSFKRQGPGRGKADSAVLFSRNRTPDFELIVLQRFPALHLCPKISPCGCMPQGAECFIHPSAGQDN